MSHWWKYPLVDVLPFSLQVYYRLLEIYNQAFWPLQIAALVAACLILVRLSRRDTGPLVVTPLCLAVAFVWIAWAFFIQSYATLNWAAPFFAGAFVLQAVIFATMALPRYRLHLAQPRSRRAVAGFAVFALALVIYPLLPLAADRPWLQAEYVGFGPDPTAIAALGILAASQGRLRWFAMVIPVLWCLISGGIQATLGSHFAWLAVAGATVAIVAALTPAKAVASRAESEATLRR
ncbi:MAG: DUF6064 family protein [Pseudomonadota bacterium]